MFKKSKENIVSKDSNYDWHEGISMDTDISIEKSGGTRESKGLNIVKQTNT